MSRQTLGLCLALGILVALLPGCDQHQHENDAIFTEKLACPAPAADEFEPWGEGGVQHVCKTRQGPFVAFEGGHLRIRGQYENGKEAGTWRWYGADGKVEKEITYPAVPPSGAESHH